VERSLFGWPLVGCRVLRSEGGSGALWMSRSC
jgi:hypothetical protein